MTATAETIQTRHGRFVIEQSKAPQTATAIANGITRTLVIRRPQGRKLGLMHEFNVRGEIVHGAPIFV